MARYLKNSVVIEAVQWFKHGDHPAVLAGSAGDAIGYIDTPEGRLRVEAGDWIITGIAGENYPCKPDIFERLYAPAQRSGGMLRVAARPVFPVVAVGQAQPHLRAGSTGP